MKAATATAACLVALLAGCATAPPPPEPSVEAPVSDEARSAAELMQRAGAAPANRAAALYLQAAWAYLSVDDPLGARASLDLVEPGQLDDQGLVDYRLVTAKLAVIEGRPGEAADAISRLPRSAMAVPRAVRIQSEVCAAQADYDCALSSLVRIAGDDPEDIALIWRWLNASASLSESLGAGRTGSSVLADWRGLHRALVTAYSMADARDRANAWLAAHPDHPAALAPPDAVTAIAAYRPVRTHVGLVVPLSGPLARAGEAVRDGFIASALVSGAGNLLDLTVYDAAAEPIPVIYERLLADRVDLVIGPLQKETAQEMNALNPELPTLVLNYLEAPASPARGLQQVGLAIEDEARTIARRLADDGIRQALLFHNYEDWSMRARRTLVEQTDAGGRIELTVQPFTDVRTVTEAVGSAMHVAGSQARRDQLAAALGVQLEFQPRARDDVDAVVALISNGEANALVPALRFHYADQLPVFASAQVTRTSRGLGTLEGFHVSELPFFLDGDPLYQVMSEPFTLDRNPFASLVALGSDAFRLAERMRLGGDVTDLPLLGSTGLLRRHPDGRFTRELAWGVISSRRVTAEFRTGP